MTSRKCPQRFLKGKVPTTGSGSISDPSWDSCKDFSKEDTGRAFHEVKIADSEKLLVYLDVTHVDFK